MKNQSYLTNTIIISSLVVWVGYVGILTLVTLLGWLYLSPAFKKVKWTKLTAVITGATVSILLSWFGFLWIAFLLSFLIEVYSYVRPIVLDLKEQL